MHNPVLEVIRQKSPGEWARIRPRVTIDQDGDEIVRGIRDIAFVAKVNETRVYEAIRGGCLGVPVLVVNKTPIRGGSQSSFVWWCYLEDLMNWRRYYSGKSDYCPPTTELRSQERVDSKYTVGGQQVPPR